MLEKIAEGFNKENAVAKYTRNIKTIQKAINLAVQRGQESLADKYRVKKSKLLQTLSTNMPEVYDAVLAHTGTSSQRERASINKGINIIETNAQNNSLLRGEGSSEGITKETSNNKSPLSFASAPKVANTDLFKRGIPVMYNHQWYNLVDTPIKDAHGKILTDNNGNIKRSIQVFDSTGASKYFTDASDPGSKIRTGLLSARADVIKKYATNPRGFNKYTSDLANTVRQYKSIDDYYKLPSVIQAYKMKYGPQAPNKIKEALSAGYADPTSFNKSIPRRVQSIKKYISGAPIRSLTDTKTNSFARKYYNTANKSWNTPEIMSMYGEGSGMVDPRTTQDVIHNQNLARWYATKPRRMYQAQAFKLSSVLSSEVSKLRDRINSNNDGDSTYNPEKDMTRLKSLTYMLRKYDPVSTYNNARAGGTVSAKDAYAIMLDKFKPFVGGYTNSSVRPDIIQNALDPRGGSIKDMKSLNNTSGGNEAYTQYVHTHPDAVSSTAGIPNSVKQGYKKRTAQLKYNEALAPNLKAVADQKKVVSKARAEANRSMARKMNTWKPRNILGNIQADLHSFRGNIPK